MLSHYEIESTASRHQYFITKRGILISSLDFSLLRQAGISRLACCDERVFRLARLVFYHHKERTFSSRALQRAEISISRILSFSIATSRNFRLAPCNERDVAVSCVLNPFLYIASLCHQQLDRQPRAARVLMSSSFWPSHDSRSAAVEITEKTKTIFLPVAVGIIKLKKLELYASCKQLLLLRIPTC